MPRDTGIADRLRAAGLKVVEVDGWRTRGSDSFRPKGSVDHHTAGARTGNAPSLRICINGRTGLPGPLCNVLVGRDNTCYVIAAGKANHAGSGGWRGLSGNSSVYGVERENVGTSAEPWRPDQTEAAVRIHAALLRGTANPDPSLVCGHREWAPGRKSDAHSIDYRNFRTRVALALAGHPEEGDDMPIPIFQPGLDGQPTSAQLYADGGDRLLRLTNWDKGDGAVLPLLQKGEARILHVHPDDVT